MGAVISFAYRLMQKDNGKLGSSRDILPALIAYGLRKTSQVQHLILLSVRYIYRLLLMAHQSRTHKSIINAVVTLLFYLGNVTVSVFARPIFLEHLGAEVQGLQSTISSIFAAMGLAELGIGAAIAYALYKPLYREDTEQISEIISLQGWLYRRIALGVSILAVVLLCFFPYIFTEVKPIEAPLWYAFGAFGVGFVNTIIGYLLNYRAIIFSADQRSYRLTMNIQGFYIGRNILQMLVLLYLPNPYAYYLVLELLVSIIGAVVLERTIHKDYPWLHTDVRQGKQLLKKYPEILKKTKQLFLHKAGHTVYSNAIPLVMAALVSFVTIAAYGNYMILYSNIGVILNSISNGVAEGIGNLVAEGDEGKMRKVLWEFTAIKHFFATVTAFAIYFFADHLIPIWLGDNPEYRLDKDVVFWFSVYVYANMIRGPIENFIGGKGLYGDVWAVPVEIILNLGLCIVLGIHYGLSGILIGNIISVLLIAIVWKVYYLFRQGFGWSPWIYWRSWIKYPVVALGTGYAMNLFLLELNLDYSSLWQFISNGGSMGLMYIVCLGIIYYLTSVGFRDIFQRFIDVVRVKVKGIVGRA